METLYILMIVACSIASILFIGKGENTRHFSDE